MSAFKNEDRIAAIDTLTNKVIATSPIGQAPQAVVYVPNAIPVVSNHGAEVPGRTGLALCPHRARAAGSVRSR
jgi:YVTN family beta-propeller protein